jgi:hypothetical protein
VALDTEGAAKKANFSSPTSTLHSTYTIDSRKGIPQGQ